MADGWDLRLRSGAEPPIRRPSSGRGTRFAGWGTIRVDHVPAIPLEDALRLHDAGKPPSLTGDSA